MKITFVINTATNNLQDYLVSSFVRTGTAAAEVQFQYVLGSLTILTVKRIIFSV